MRLYIPYRWRAYHTMPRDNDRAEAKCFFDKTTCAPGFFSDKNLALHVARPLVVAYAQRSPGLIGAYL